MESATPFARSKEMKRLFVKILNLEQKAQGCDLVYNWLYFNRRLEPKQQSLRRMCVSLKPSSEVRQLLNHNTPLFDVSWTCWNAGVVDCPMFQCYDQFSEHRWQKMGHEWHKTWKLNISSKSRIPYHPMSLCPSLENRISDGQNSFPSLSPGGGLPQDRSM